MRNPIQLLKGSLSIFGENPALFVGILIVPVIFTILASLFGPAERTTSMGGLEWIVYMIFTLGAMIINVFMGIAVTLAVNNRTLTVRSAYKAATPYFWRYIGLSIVLTLVLVVAYILLIIPGVILSVWLAFATFVLILENTGIIEAMKQSRTYVKGKWWGVFGRLVAMIAMSCAVMIALVIIAAILPGGIILENLIGTIVSLFIAPIIVGYMYLLYQDLKSGVPVVPETSSMGPGAV